MPSALLPIVGDLLRPYGTFAHRFIPSSLFDDRGVHKYVCSRLLALFKLRVQQGKPHDHANFHKVRKALKRLFTPGSTIVKIIEDSYDGNSDVLLDELLEVYIIHLRKSLLSAIIRVVAPRLVGVALTSDDGSATIKHGGPLAANNSRPYRIERDEKIRGRTTLHVFGPCDPDDDVTRASIFPGKTIEDMAPVGREIVDHVNKLR